MTNTTLSSKPLTRFIQHKTISGLVEGIKKFHSTSRALSTAKLLTRWMPEDPTGYYQWGKLLLAIGNDSEAREKLTQAKYLAEVDSNHLMYISFIPKINSALECFNMRNIFNIFPNEVLHDIFSLLDIWDWIQLQQVSRRWYHFIKEDPKLCPSFLSFHKGHSKGCNESILRNFLEYACKGSSPHIYGIHLEKFESLESEVQCLKLLDRKVFSKLFPNLTVQILILERYTSIGPKFYENLIPTTELIGSKSILTEWDNIYLDSILRYQPQLESLTLKGAVWSGNLLTTTHNFTLKRLEVESTVFSMEIAIAYLNSFPNLVYYVFWSIGSNKFYIQEFCKYASNSKLKTLGLASFDFIRSSNEDMDSIDTPSWPKELEVLGLFQIAWSEYSLIKGSLESVKMLSISGNINMANFFKQYKLGNNLHQLRIRAPVYQHESWIWEKCPNLISVSICRTLIDASEFIRGILIHCPKLETAELEGEFISDEMIVALSNKAGMKMISFIDIGCKSRIDSLSLGDVRITFGFGLDTYYWLHEEVWY